MTRSDIISLLGSEEATLLLDHVCEKVPRSSIATPSLDTVRTVFRSANRSFTVLKNLMRLYQSGRLAGTGYLSIFPVDQALEHTAGYSFAANPRYFDPETIIEMAVQGECSGVASSAGVLGLVSKKYASRIPLIVKLNHSEHLSIPDQTNQIMFSSVKQAAEMGAVAVGATVYFGSDLSHRQITEIAEAFETAHSLGLATILWCYPRNQNYKTVKVDYASSVDLTAQAIHLGVTLGADIVKQKMPTATFAFKSLNFSKYSDEMYIKLMTKHPIDLVRYQVLHAYTGKISLLNSGGEASNSANLQDDLKSAVRAAIINKRGGGAGLIMGRKVFKRSMTEGAQILRAVQDVYLSPDVTIA